MDAKALIQDLLYQVEPAYLMEQVGYSPDPWQRGLLNSLSRRILVMCSRQAGKSTTNSILALAQALFHPGSLVLILSPSLRQSGELFKKILFAYSRVADLYPSKSETALTLTFENGSRIISLPGSEETIRGYSGVALLIIDEASRVDDALYMSVRPMLAVSGGRLVALTTPFGRRGWFYEAWENGGDTWERIRVPATMIPRITPEFLEEEKNTMGDWWYDQEYMCEFRDAVDSMFSVDLVDRASHDSDALDLSGDYLPKSSDPLASETPALEL